MKAKITDNTENEKVNRQGDVNYELTRVFSGSRTATELLIDHVVDRVREETAVDVTDIPAV